MFFSMFSKLNCCYPINILAASGMFSFIILYISYQFSKIKNIKNRPPIDTQKDNIHIYLGFIKFSGAVADRVIPA